MIMIVRARMTMIVRRRRIMIVLLGNESDN